MGNTGWAGEDYSTMRNGDAKDIREMLLGRSSRGRVREDEKENMEEWKIF